MTQVQQQRRNDGEARRREPSGPQAPILAALSEREVERHERILSWRRDEAERRQVPHHRVLSNQLALDLARGGVESLEGLMRHGLNEHRVAHFGKELLQLLRSL